MATAAYNAYPQGISRGQLYTAFGNRGIPQLVRFDCVSVLTY